MSEPIPTDTPMPHQSYHRTSGPIFSGIGESYKRWCVDVVSPQDKQFKLNTLTGLQSYFHTSDTDLEKLKAAFITSKLWSPNTILTIGFLASNSNETNLPDTWAWKRAWVCKVVREQIEPYAQLTFQYKLNPSLGSGCHIRISFDPYGGCYSRLGTDALQNWGGLNETMNFGWMDAPFNHTFTWDGVSYTTPGSFDQGGYLGQGTTISHEFGHALGMVHEHQTPFNNPLVWDRQKVYQIFEGPPNNWSRADIDYNIIDRYSTSGLNGSSFDSHSIMKYYFPAQLLVNPSSELSASVQRINLTLSDCDKYWIAYNYPGKVPQADMNTLQENCLAETTPLTPTPTPVPSTMGSRIGFYLVCALVIYVIYLIVKSMMEKR